MLDTHTEFIRFIFKCIKMVIEEWHEYYFVPSFTWLFHGVFQIQSLGEPIPRAAVVFGPKEDTDSSQASRVQRKNSISLSVARFQRIQLSRY